MNDTLTVNAVADNLDGAADYIEKHGWWRGPAGFGPQGQACALNALFNARSELTIMQALYCLRKHVGGRVPTWNDAPGRTKQEVLDALRGAAKRVRMGELP